MDVREWLRGLGLGQYGQKFQDHKIDADVLGDLTDGDLEKLGIPLGDRKRLLKAIAAHVAPPELRAAQRRLVVAAPALAPQTLAGIENIAPAFHVEPNSTRRRTPWLS